MKSFRFLALAVLVAFGGSANAFAQSDGHTVTLAVSSINVLAITGNVELTISAATPGSNPDPVSGSASYAITTNDTSKKITASTDQNLAAGFTLEVDVDAPAGATGSTGTSLSTSAVDVVTNLATVAEAGMGLDYTFTATAAAGTLASTGLTVTYTITN